MDRTAILNPTNKIDKAVIETYRRCYKIAEPSADFDQLVMNAPINKFGQIQIDFESYLITYEKLEEIINDICNEICLPKSKRIQFKNTILMGCSPSTKMRE